MYIHIQYLCIHIYVHMYICGHMYIYRERERERHRERERERERETHTFGKQYGFVGSTSPESKVGIPVPDFMFIG